MIKAIIVTPVKNAIENTLETAAAISKSSVPIKHIIFNDFSNEETKVVLEENKSKYGYDLIHIEDLTQNPSPNYKLVLIESQKLALEHNIPLILVESDVVVKEDTFAHLLDYYGKIDKAGMVAAITVGFDNQINFPYLRFKNKQNSKSEIETKKSLSFCCTLIGLSLLKNYDLNNLNNSKDWFDTFLSDKSVELGFKNILLPHVTVLHKPHGSRPWKQLKYTNPIKYYFLKYLKRRDKI